MSTTVNNTLPKMWDATVTYGLQETAYFNNIIYQSLVNNNLNHRPDEPSSTYWKALDTYKKELTVMEHGDYSGDESFWDRDQFFIDVDGYVYMNGENTGINVNGRTTVDVKWEDLTPTQREQLKGDTGPQGPRGIQGIQGETGPMGAVEWDNLTPLQIEQLRGLQGKSTYEIWLEQGHTGTEVDFLCWLQSNIIHIDNALNTSSVNPVQNKVIALALNTYMVKVNDLLRQYESRIQDLENRLKATYNGQEHTFSYGITEGGKHGYRIDNSDTVIPFDATSDVLSSLAAFTLGGISLSAFGERAELVAETIPDQNRLGIGSSSIKGKPSINSTELNGTSINSKSNEQVKVQEFNDFFQYTVNKGYIYRDNQFEKGVSYDLTGMTYSEENGLIAQGLVETEGIIIPFETVSQKNTGFINFEIEPAPNSSCNYIIGYATSTYGQGSTVSLSDLVSNPSQTNIQETGSITSKKVISFKVPRSDVLIYFSKSNIKSFKIHNIYFTAEKPEEV